MQDELIQALVNRNGKLVPREEPDTPASPSHVQVPRTIGRDLADDLSFKPGDSRNPIDLLLKGAGTLGVAAPISLIEALLDRYRPRTQAVDVELPNKKRMLDPRIIDKSFGR